MSNQALNERHINKKLEFSRIQFNRSKLRNEDRMLNLILQRVYVVKKRMGAEFALEDTVTYLKKWKKSINKWQKLSKIKLTQLETIVQKEPSWKVGQKGKIDE
jgi:uncharacterized protein (UPF0276 family)